MTNRERAELEWLEEDKRYECETCGGSGGPESSPCVNCAGKGYVYVVRWKHSNSAHRYYHLVSLRLKEENDALSARVKELEDWLSRFEQDGEQFALGQEAERASALRQIDDTAKQYREGMQHGDVVSTLRTLKRRIEERGNLARLPLAEMEVKVGILRDGIQRALRVLFEDDMVGGRVYAALEKLLRDTDEQ